MTNYDSACDEYQTDFAASERMFESSRTSIFEWLLLLVMWFVVLYSSVRGLGKVGAGMYLFIAGVLVFLRPSNSVLIWIMGYFTPDASMSFQVSSMFRIILVISFVGYILHGKFTNLSRFVTRLILIASALVAFYTFLLLIAPDKSAAWGAYIPYVQALITLIMLYGLIDKPEEVIRVFKWWAIIAAMSIVVSLVHQYYGNSSFLANVVFTVEEKGEKNLEFVSTMGDVGKRLLWPGLAPSGQSINLVFPVGLALAFFMAASGTKKVFWLCILMTNVICMLGTFSRSGFLVLCGIAVLYAIMRNVKAIIPLGIILAFSLLLVVSVPFLQDRIFSIKENVESSGGTGRFTLWSAAISDWISSPIWGHGLESFITRNGLVVHNTYFQLLAEGGIIGLGLYLLFLITVYLSLKRLLGIFKEEGRNREYVFVMGLMFGFVGFCFHLNTITYTIPMYFWWQCGLCCILDNALMKERKGIYISEEIQPEMFVSTENNY